jgi:hypothetical protein
MDYGGQAKTMSPTEPHLKTQDAVVRNVGIIGEAAK